jgi:hypothetical protein
MIVDAPWYVPNTVIRRDLQTPIVKEVIRRYASQYSARLSAHPNDLVVNFLEPPDNRRLQTPAKCSANQILSVIDVFVTLAFKVYFASFSKVTRDLHYALFYIVYVVYTICLLY